MIYRLAVACAGGVDAVDAVLSEVRSTAAFRDLSQEGALDLTLSSVMYEPTRDELQEWLGQEATAQIVFDLNYKASDQRLIAQSRCRLLLSAAEIASRLDATAVLADEGARSIIERREKRLSLYSWFPECSDEALLAELHDPYEITDATGYLP